ncbi:MAG: flagellar hook-length control protein FliK, partial [Phenylobacterium sp.]
AMAVTDPVTPVAPQARSAYTPAPAAGEDREDLFASADPAEPAPAPAGPVPTAALETRPAASQAAEATPLQPRAGAETVAALAAQMARRLDDGITRFDLELNPGDLGRVDVRLEIDAAGAVRAAFTFEHAHAASELGRRADDLQKSLESAGFNLSGGLSFDVSGDRSQSRNPAWSDSRDNRPQTAQAPTPEAPREGLGEIADALNGRRTAARSGVDIRI